MIDFLIRRAWIIFFLALFSAGIGAHFSTKLFMNLKADIEELLPTTARSVTDLDEVTHRLQAIESLAVLVFSDDTKASRRFVDDLSAKLNLAPKEVIASVEYKIDRELAFFKARRALYIDTHDLVKIRVFVAARLEYEKNLYNPLNIFSGNELIEPKFDFNALEKKYSGKVSSYSRFPGGYYATPDEKKRVILVYMPGKTGGSSNLHGLKDFVVKSIQELKPETYAKDLEIKYTGGVQNTIEEQAALVEDLLLSTVVVIVLTSLAMLIFFKAVRATIALILALFTGVLWTFGASYFAVGYLNANTAFLGSIVIGNGINFGIIYLARYIEERRLGHPHTEALQIAAKATAPATLTAALAAGLSYGSLMLTQFRGFSQFGVIGLLGMVLCWISTYTLLPVFLTLFEKIKPIVKPKNMENHSHGLMGLVAKAVNQAPGLISLGSLIFLIMTALSLSQVNPGILEADLSKLRDKRSMTEGSGYLSKYIDEIFQRYLAPMVILPHSHEDARKIAAILKEKKNREGDKSLIASVQTLDDFLPVDQEKKIRLFREIKETLPARYMRRLDEPTKVKIREFLTPIVFKPIQEHDIPEMILKKFTERDGKVGNLVLIEPPLGDASLDRDSLVTFVKDLREAADSVAPRTPLAGGLAVSADMLASIMSDGPKATLFAFLAVVLLVILLFRNLKTIGLCLFALMIGMVWMSGIVVHYHLKVNFLNFIALPITFGIGIDYGVNIFQRYRLEGEKNILKVVREAGGAVALCSLTTTIGYGSLLIAGNQAFVSFGRMAILGEMTCVTAAIVSLPAFLTLIHRKKVAI